MLHVDMGTKDATICIIVTYSGSGQVLRKCKFLQTPCQRWIQSGPQISLAALDRILLIFLIAPQRNESLMKIMFLLNSYRFGPKLSSS